MGKRMVVQPGAGDPSAYGQKINLVGPDGQPWDLPATYVRRSVSTHATRQASIRQAKGGSIGTNGKPVIAFRIDHGAQAWLATVWPLFKARGLTASYGCLTSSFAGGPGTVLEPTTYTWADLQSKHREGFEVWAHSQTHKDPAVAGTTIESEVIGSADLIEAQNIRVMGWQQPGISGNTTPGYSSDWDNAGRDWSDTYGQAVLGRYGLAEMGDVAHGNKYRWLPHHGGYDLPHYTLDGVTDAAAIAYIDTAIAKGMSIEFMLHPEFIVGNTVNGAVRTVTMTQAMLTAVLDRVKVLRDAGTVMVLTASGMAFADPTHSRRLNLFSNSDFEGGVTGWSLTSGAVLNTDGGFSGANYVRLPASGAQARQTLNDSSLSALGVKGGTFEIEARVRVNGTGTPNLRFLVLDASNSLRLNVQSNEVHSPGGWKKVSYPFTLPLDTDAIQLDVTWTGAAHAGATVDVDDIRIMPI